MNFIIQKENGCYDYDFQWATEQSINHENWGRKTPKYTYSNISYNELKESKIDPNSIYVGSIEFMKLVFFKLNVSCPSPLNIPKELYEFCDRKIWHGYKSDIKIPCFIKPADDLKLFTGFLLEKDLDLKLYYPEIKDDTKLMFSEPKNFISEYRGFVYKHQLVSIKHYQGDFKKFPNLSLVERMISYNYLNSPVAYTIDFGVTNEGKTILVELNDFWSCGLYGFDDKLLNMLADRFRQIISKS